MFEDMYKSTQPSTYLNMKFNNNINCTQAEDNVYLALYYMFESSYKFRFSSR